MRAIERRVCGCDFGGNSWTSTNQANAMLSYLGLGPRSNLIDLGAGTGWPGIYFAKNSGCSVTLVDLPEIGLQIARKRASEEGLADRISTCVADAADLPFSPKSFDAVSHSDLLCCLVRKRDALEQCRKVIRDDGLMAFTVISLATDLSAADYERAINNAPDFIEVEIGYHELLAGTGWVVVTCSDLTSEYRASCKRQIEADHECRAELAELLGKDQAIARMDTWRSKLQAIEDGLYLRELYVCRPAFRDRS